MYRHIPIRTYTYKATLRVIRRMRGDGSLFRFVMASRRFDNASIHLSLHLSVKHYSIYVFSSSIYVSISQLVYTSFKQYIQSPINQSINLSICPSIYLSINLSPHECITHSLTQSIHLINDSRTHKDSQRLAGTSRDYRGTISINVSVGLCV